MPRTTTTTTDIGSLLGKLSPEQQAAFAAAMLAAKQEGMAEAANCRSAGGTTVSWGKTGQLHWSGSRVIRLRADHALTIVATYGTWFPLADNALQGPMTTEQRLCGKGAEQRTVTYVLLGGVPIASGNGTPQAHVADVRSLLARVKAMGIKG